MTVSAEAHMRYLYTWGIFFRRDNKDQELLGKHAFLYFLCFDYIIKLCVTAPIPLPHPPPLAPLPLTPTPFFQVCMDETCFENCNWAFVLMILCLLFLENAGHCPKAAEADVIRFPSRDDKDQQLSCKFISSALGRFPFNRQNRYRQHCHCCR